MAKEPTSEVLKKMSEPKEPTEPTETEPTETETEPKINWRENYIRTKLYAYQGGIRAHTMLLL